MSYADCIRIRVSIFTPNAFSMRSAISPERLAFPFNKPESAGRDTPSTFAAAVTDNSAGSTISVRMKSPGCGGFFRGISVSNHLVVVFQFQFADIPLGFINTKGQAPISGNHQTPHSLAVVGQQMGLPVG